MNFSIADHVLTYYMSRRLDLPPLLAQAAYDAYVDDGDQGRWLVTTDTARLELSGPVRQPPAAPGWQPLRRQSGVLVAGRLRWPVELELLPWSRDRTELGLFPQSRLLRTFPPATVTLAGHELLRGLAASMHAWADQPLREWASDPRTRQTLANWT